MKYYEVIFSMDCEPELRQDACDVLSALAGEVGFETFEETDEGLKGYIQRELFNSEALDGVLASFPFETVVGYEVKEAEDKDWNEQWEQEGFEPIEVSWKAEEGTEKTLVIHDGRHLPSDISRQEAAIMIEIDAHLAFGTGTHETTQMVCATLLDHNLKGKRVLDCGCGTGILSICALKLGAAQATGYDIDEWSVDNTRHNAVINQVDDRLEVLHGDCSILNKVEGVFDVVVANINRNILLNDMPAIKKKMAPKAILILSGFYTADIPLLAEKAKELNLQLTAQRTNNDWACITLYYASSGFMFV